MWEKSKTFSFLGEMKKKLQKSINEATGDEPELDDEAMPEDDPEMGEENIDADTPEATTPADDNAPEDQAEPETGVFISANQKAVIAKSLMDALMSTPPKPGEIPAQLTNVNVNNADQVIQYIQQFLSVEKSVDEGDENNPESLVNQVKSIS